MNGEREGATGKRSRGQRERGSASAPTGSTNSDVVHSGSGESEEGSFRDKGNHQ